MTTTTRILLAAIAVVFTIGLTFASVEFPLLASRALMDHVEAPGFDATYHPEETEAFLAAHRLRLIGTTGLILTGVLIHAGLVTERRGMAATGAVLFFLPVFGHFAASMFFLAGLAALRVVWLPILDVSHEVLALGDVVYLPYAAAVYPLVNLGLDVRDTLPWSVMGLGVAIFIASTMTWMTSRYQGSGVADAWLYRISRHPQYLGWIICRRGVHPGPANRPSRAGSTPRWCFGSRVRRVSEPQGRACRSKKKGRRVLQILPRRRIRERKTPGPRPGRVEVNRVPRYSTMGSSVMGSRSGNSVMGPNSVKLAS